MRYLVTKEIKSETQVFWKLYFRDFVFLILWIGISRFLESAVHTYLQIPFLIFSIVMGVILVLPSSQNPKRRQYQSIALYLMQTKKTYYLLPKKKEKKTDEEMYPCNTTKQQEYWKHIAEKNQNPDFEPMIRKKISELEYRERYTVKKEFFLQFFWKTEAEIKSGRKAIESVIGVRKLHGECGITELLEEISPTKKEQVLFKIANKNSQIF